MPRTDGQSGVVVPRQLRWHQRAAVSLLTAGMKLVIKTWRRRWNTPAAYLEPIGPVIYCVWHNRLALGVATYDDYSRDQWRAKGLAVMVSASKDGGVLAAVLEKFRIQPIRGSTSRRGPQALLEAARWTKRGYSIAITPDGPRGPVYHVQEGIISLAQLTGLPILPISNSTNWKIRLGSWDRFQIPLPFAQCELVFGHPIHVPRRATPEDREQIRLQLEKAMRQLTQDY